MALTDSKLKNLKPADKVYKVVDRDGMYVVVSLKGTLSFRYDYRLGTRRETLTLAHQAVSTMRQYIESPQSLQNIILVGGGAFLFKKAVKAGFPNHRIHEVKEPMFANVRGFQLAGQNYARTVMAGARAERGTIESGGDE